MQEARSSLANVKGISTAESNSCGKNASVSGLMELEFGIAEFR